MEFLMNVPTYIQKGESCPYLSNKIKQYRYATIIKLKDDQLDLLLSHGWRHFGYTFFIPSCPECKLCIPIRIKTLEFQPTKSQKRTIKKNIATTARISNLKVTKRIIDIYINHSLSRFGSYPSPFFLSILTKEKCTNSYQIEYYQDNTLFAVDYVDETNTALSSIYFIYHSAFAKLSPGIFSILYAITLAQQKNLPYLYLGYFVPNAKFLHYKISFHPFEWYSWRDQTWLPEPITI